MDRGPLTIGPFAGAAGVNAETVRYSQRVGLIEEPRKPAKGYRRYPDTAVHKIRFIKRAQRLGFALHGIEEFMGLGVGRCSEVRRRVQAKRAAIVEQIKGLQAPRQNIDRLIAGCEARKQATARMGDRARRTPLVQRWPNRAHRRKVP